jgi:rod shape-determining protein MreC
MRSPRFFLGALLVLILIFAAFFYRNEILSFSGIIRSLDYEKLENLRLENLALKNELEILKEKGESVQNFYVAAKIYSRYPFNDRRLITINLGEKEGVRVGMPVLAKEGVLLGKINQVFGRESLVETVFDPAWRSSVIVGEKTQALLEGGARPLLTLIARESVVSPGDLVLNTSPEFPLELLLGEIKEVKPASDDIWLVAELDTLYNPEDLTEVLVVTNFP